MLLQTILFHTRIPRLNQHLNGGLISEGFSLCLKYPKIAVKFWQTIARFWFFLSYLITTVCYMHFCSKQIVSFKKLYLILIYELFTFHEFTKTSNFIKASLANWGIIWQQQIPINLILKNCNFYYVFIEKKSLKILQSNSPKKLTNIGTFPLLFL